ncbi:MAG: class I SAM-dependent methyltransferase [Bacillota bacterium]
MLNKTRKRLKEYNNYNLKEGSAYNLPYKNSSFDLIINNYFLSSKSKYFSYRNSKSQKVIISLIEYLGPSI